MAKETVGYEVPAQVREMAEKSVDQAKKAFDGFISQAQKAVTAAEGQASAVQAGAKDFNTKALSFAEANVAASFDFAQKLVAAKDVSEIVKLQTEFLQAQMKSMGDQAKELSASATKAMTDAAKPKM
jgi:phasin